MCTCIPPTMSWRAAPCISRASAKYFSFCVGICSRVRANGWVEAAIGASPWVAASSTIIARRRDRSARASEMEWQTRVLTSSWERRNSGLIWPSPRSVHSRSSSCGGFSSTSRESRSTSRYSSSIPTVKGGSAVLTAGSLEPLVYPSEAQVGNRPWIGDEVALREIDPDALQLIQHGLALDAFGDRGDAQCPADFADGFNHAAIDRVLRHLADELPVDLQEIHGQGLQVHE